MSIQPDKVPFGYSLVDPEMKKRLVHDQFTPIARRYDRADALLSFGLHFLWKGATIRSLGLRPGEAVLDVCGGTADLALLAARRVGPDGGAVVCDFNRPMMIAGRRKALRRSRARKVLFVQGDAEELPFPGSSFDAVTIGFGLRNLVQMGRGLHEFNRALKPGGRLAVLEFSLPRRPWQRSLYAFYSFRIMPPAARLITGTDVPFRYLAESIRVFPPPEDVAARLAGAGFREIVVRPLSFGLATIYSGKKRQEPPHAPDQR